MATDQRRITQADLDLLNRDLWYAGQLRWILRRHGQRRIHDFVMQCMEEDSFEPIVVVTHRRLGKSFLPIALSVERCLQQPGMRCVYGAPTHEQVMDIVEPNYEIIMRSCPAELLPRSRGRARIFHNPRWVDPGTSTMKMVGVDVKRGDNLRGTFADIMILDEAREMAHLRYMVEEVIIPQFTGRDRPLLLIISTPPRTNDHDLARYFRPQAMAAGRYLEIKGSENPDFTERDQELILAGMGGDKQSIAWRREVECDFVPDPEDLITPEFAEARADIVVKEYPRPQWFFPWTCMDTGFDPDFTAILFGYVDFRNQLLVIEDEIFRRRMTLLDISKAVRKKEAELWGKPYHPVRRIADIDSRGLEDLRRMFKLNFRAADKFNAESALARMRSNLRTRKIRIQQRCVRLIDQLSNGIWHISREGKRTDFERTEQNGHWDAGKALCYLNKMVNWREMPDPPDAYDPNSQFRSCVPDQTHDTLMVALGRK